MSCRPYREGTYARHHRLVPGIPSNQFRASVEDDAYIEKTTFVILSAAKDLSLSYISVDDVIEILCRTRSVA
jgi:hypothetical protein